MRGGGLALVVSLAWVSYGCGSSDGVEPPPPPSGPGVVAFDVVTAAEVDDGALLLTVLGGAVDSVTALAGYEVFHAATATGARAMVFGTIVDGPLLGVWVPDLSQAGGYSVRVDEGAARESYGVVAAASYQVSRRP
jgi:hypothetical protein